LAGRNLLPTPPKGPEVRQYLEELMGHERRIDDPVERTVQELCALRQGSRGVADANSTDKIIVLLKRCIGDYRAMRCLRLGAAVRLIAPVASAAPGEVPWQVRGMMAQREDSSGLSWRPIELQGTAKAVTAGVPKWKSRVSQSPEDAPLKIDTSDSSSPLQEPLIFLFAHMVDLLIPPRSTMSGPAFTIVMDSETAEEAGSIATFLQSSPSQKSVGESEASYSYTFVVDTRDELFMWVRGLSIVLEKLGRCKSSYTTLDIHKALQNEGNSLSIATRLA